MDWIFLLKSSSIVDLIFIVLVLLASFVVVLTAIAVAIFVKKRSVMIVLLVLALLPLGLAMIGAGWRMYENETLLAANEITGRHAEEDRERFRSESLMMCLTGVPGTVVPLLIGAAALVLKGRKR